MPVVSRSKDSRILKNGLFLEFFALLKERVLVLSTNLCVLDLPK
jgi:hypothetical protein